MSHMRVHTFYNSNYSVPNISDKPGCVEFVVLKCILKNLQYSGEHRLFGLIEVLHNHMDPTIDLKSTTAHSVHTIELILV